MLLECYILELLFQDVQTAINSLSASAPDGLQLKQRVQELQAKGLVLLACSIAVVYSIMYLATAVQHTSG